MGEVYDFFYFLVFDFDVVIDVLLGMGIIWKVSGELEKYIEDINVVNVFWIVIDILLGISFDYLLEGVVIWVDFMLVIGVFKLM